MALKSQHYPMSEPPVKPEGERANEPGRAMEHERPSERQLDRGNKQPAHERASEAPTRDERASDMRSATLIFRLLNYKDISEVRAFITLLYAISAEADPFHFDKSSEFIDGCVVKARREEMPHNTFAALALEGKEMVGVHVVRRFEEGPLVGAHVAGLWVAKRWRGCGVARRLKAMGEAWARSIGAHFLNSNVLVRNDPMLELNRKLGFETYRVNLRKRL
jgi:GNAT superfamily N-acetyltransferase